MAVLFLDSFDDRQTNYGAKYDAAGGTLARVASARTGSGVNLLGSAHSFLQKSFAARAGWTVGLALRYPTQLGSPVPFLDLLDGTGQQLFLRANSTQTVSLLRGDGTVLGTTMNQLSSSVFATLELKAVIDGAAGSYGLKLNGLLEFSASSVNTRATGNNQATAVKVYCPSGGAAFDLDDFYIGDTTGGANNDFPGPVKISCLRPSASGAYSQWLAASIGQPNYTQVNEADTDGDSTFVAAVTGGTKDSYGIGALPASGIGTISALQLGLWARRDDILARKLQGLLRSGGTEVTGSTLFTLNNSYAFYDQIWETDPHTGVAWLTAAVNAAEIGMIVNS